MSLISVLAYANTEECARICINSGAGASRAEHCACDQFNGADLQSFAAESGALGQSLAKYSGRTNLGNRTVSLIQTAWKQAISATNISRT